RRTRREAKALWRPVDRRWSRMQRLRAMTCVGTRRVSYGIAWCRAADLSRLARYRGSALLGAPAARSLQRPGAGVPRPGGGWALSGASRGVGPPRAGEGDGGGWGERRGALPEQIGRASCRERE